MLFVILKFITFEKICPARFQASQYALRGGSRIFWIIDRGQTDQFDVQYLQMII